MTLKDADKIKEAIMDSDDFVGCSDDIKRVIDSVPEVVIGTDTDTISRSEAIKAIDDCDWYECGGMDTDGEWIYKENVVELLEQLEPLPHTEPHWIPVTETTPTEDDDYWATFEAETGRFVDWASWYQGRWVVWIDGSPAPLSNVIAWSKPMEPYKGVTT